MEVPLDKPKEIGRPSVWFAGCLILGLIGQRPARSQDQAAAPPAAGACDSPYPDAQGNVTFTCRGLNDEQMRRLPSLFKMLQEGLDSKSEPAPVAKPSINPRAVPPATPAREKEVITYDYRGYKTSSRTGPMLLDGDEGESKEYRKLLALQKADEWKKLLKETAREIKKVPDWLTPYAFKAVAQQRLGTTLEAIKTLEYVDQRSVGNPDYDQVRRLLKQLKPSE